MGSTDDREGVTCASCGARLSWRIVRDLTARNASAREVICPACRHRVTVDVQGYL
ncbi:MAG: hypothetical protein ABEJ28_06025 [Salinigranum sp.]